jgi:hypothetical protein
MSPASSNTARSTGETLSLRGTATFGDFSPQAFSAVDLGLATRAAILRLAGAEASIDAIQFRQRTTLSARFKPRR